MRAQRSACPVPAEASGSERGSSAVHAGHPAPRRVGARRRRRARDAAARRSRRRVATRSRSGPRARLRCRATMPTGTAMTRYLPMTGQIEDYVFAHTRESDIARRLRAETSGMAEAGMQIGPDQAALLALLARSIGARRAIEIGTFTGMSALAVASALPDGGRLVCCDISVEWTGI